MRRLSAEISLPIGEAAIVRDGHGELRWWTWAGFRTNATLTATLSQVLIPASASTTATFVCGRT